MGDPVLDFASIHDRFRPRVLRYLRRLAGDAEAEDLAQRVMLKVSEGLAGFRGEAALSTWIYRIATHVALDALRRRATRPAEEPWPEDEGGAVAAAAPVESAESSAARAEMSACIHDFIARLPPSQAAVIALADLEGFTAPEIASILGVSVPAAKIRIHRARERLRAELTAGCTFERGPGQGLECAPVDRPVALPGRHRS